MLKAGFEFDDIRLPRYFEEIADEGHYILFNQDHIIYGRVFPNGKRYIYDPQYDKILTHPAETLGIKSYEMNRIIKAE